MNAAVLMDIAEIALLVAAAAQTVFVVIYATKAPWRHNFIGRALFLKSTVLWLLLAISLANNYLAYPYQLETAVVLMCLLAFAVVYQCASLIDKLWLEPRRAKRS